MRLFASMRINDIAICFRPSEFLDGDKRMKKITRGYAKENLRRESYTKYSRSFRKAKIDAKTFRLDIESNQ